MHLIRFQCGSERRGGQHSLDPIIHGQEYARSQHHDVASEQAYVARALGLRSCPIAMEDRPSISTWMRLVEHGKPGLEQSSQAQNSSVVCIESCQLMFALCAQIDGSLAVADCHSHLSKWHRNRFNAIEKHLDEHLDQQQRRFFTRFIFHPCPCLDLLPKGNIFKSHRKTNAKLYHGLPVHIEYSLLELRISIWQPSTRLNCLSSPFECRLLLTHCANKFYFASKQHSHLTSCCDPELRCFSRRCLPATALNAEILWRFFPCFLKSSLKWGNYAVFSYYSKSQVLLAKLAAKLLFWREMKI